METKELIASKVSNFLKKAAALYPIEMAFLYGSWGQGYPNDESDIDIGVLFSDPIKEASEIHAIITELSYKLTLEVKKEVNIVHINPDFDHPMLYYNIINLGIPVYIKDQNTFLNLKLEALYQMEDFQLFGTRWQLDIARKILKEVSNG